MKVLDFVNFDLGGYLLQNDISGLIIEAEKQNDYIEKSKQTRAHIHVFILSSIYKLQVKNELLTKIV